MHTKRLTVSTLRARNDQRTDAQRTTRDARSRVTDAVDFPSVRRARGPPALPCVSEGHALLVGVSLGEIVALEVARRHPDRVVGLVLSGASTNYRRPWMRLLGIINWLLRAKVYPERWLTGMRVQTLRRMFATELAEQQIRAGFYFRGAAPAFRQIGRIGYLGDLAAYVGPTLILNGEKDAINRKGKAAFLSAARDARLCVIKGAGHIVHLECPREFNDAVRRFAKSIAWPDGVGRG